MQPFTATGAPAHESAQANADYFGVPYVCFFDTSGNYRTERYNSALTCHKEGTVFFPATINNNGRAEPEKPLPQIAATVLQAEEQAMKTDRELYLECLNQLPLKDRNTPQEIRDGLILYWHVYRHIKDSP